MEAGQTSSNTGPSGNSSDFVCSSQCLVRSSFLTLVGAKTLQVSLNCRFFRLLLRLFFFSPSHRFPPHPKCDRPLIGYGMLLLWIQIF